MYVCICHAVTDAEVHSAVDSGANCIDTVAAATRAGSSCATCHDTIDDLIAERCGTCPLATLSTSNVA
ncbi:MAG: (2Fe-2S)-binding protein [Gordonia polyisoprenivorans]|nr:(2Fe-2S)-binding protein [Gordonia polyisoprenivorans]